MSNDLLKKEVFSFLKSHFIGVLATVTRENRPEASTIYYFIDDNFDIYFLTTKDGSKYKNMKHSPYVTLVVGTDNIPLSSQIEGKAAEIIEKKELADYFDKLVEISSRGDYLAPLFVMKNMALSIFKLKIERIKWLDFRQSEVTGARTPQEILFS